MGFKQFSQMIFLFSITFLLIAGYFYFFQISPVFVEEPQLEKPKDIGPGEMRPSDSIIYLLNSIGAYKLHSVPFTEDLPVIEVSIHDTKENFFFGVNENKVVPIELSGMSPDIRIIISSSALMSLYNHDTPSDIIQNLYKGGDFEIMPLKEETVLALKGYKSIYDEVASKANEVTGDIIQKLNPKRSLNRMNVLLLLISSLIIGIIIEKEL